MNDHNDIRKYLSAYCGNDLEPSQALQVEQHLAACESCQRELADLKTALGLIRSTPEVEPPPWLTARIMARIRQQQDQRRSWLQRIFFPLHIKLPLEAVALLMVCVTGYYLTRSVETELKMTAPQQTREIPAAAPEQGAETKAQQDLPGRPAQQPSLQSAPHAVPRPDATKPAETPAISPNQAIPSAPPPSAPAPPAPRQEQAAPAAETLRSSPASGTAVSSSPAFPQLRQNARKESLRDDAESFVAAPPGGTTGKAAVSLPQATIRLSVADPAGAGTTIREALIRSGGSIIEDRDQERQRIKARIPAGRLDELLRRLEQLGRLTERPAVQPGARDVEVTIRW